MRMIKIIPILALLFVSATYTTNAQCKAFAKKVVLPELGLYTHDGNYHAAVLVEGEEAELYKTFYSDMDYRVSIAGEDKIPSIEFRVLDNNGNVLYSNKDDNYAKTWDFEMESSQQLKLIVKVNSSNQPGDMPASGCVAIMFGFKIRR